MAAFPAPQEVTMSEQEYLQADFEYDVDFIDGHIEDRNVGEIEHSNWQHALIGWFLNQKFFSLHVAAPEVRVNVATGKYRVPDIAIFHGAPQGRIVTSPPLAIIEILSPSDTYHRLKARMRDYHKMGVRNLFVIEGRTEFSQFKDDVFVPVRGERSLFEGSDGFVDWNGVRSLLWPNDAAETDLP